MSATSGSANSQSAREQGGSAKRERALRTRLASSGGQLTKRTEQGARRAQARATCSGSEALDLTAKKRKFFQESCAGSCRAKQDKTCPHHIRPQLPHKIKKSPSRGIPARRPEELVAYFFSQLIIWRSSAPTFSSWCSVSRRRVARNLPLRPAPISCMNSEAKVPSWISRST